MARTHGPLAALALAAAAFAGCGAASTGASHGGSGGPGEVELVNRTDETIGRLSASRCDLEPPAIDDLLGPGTTLEPGDTATVTLPGGCWNVRAEDGDGDFLTSVAGVAVGDAGVRVELTR